MPSLETNLIYDCIMYCRHVSPVHDVAQLAVQLQGALVPSVCRDIHCSHVRVFHLSICIHIFYVSVCACVLICMYVYVYIYIYYMCICIYIHIMRLGVSV